MVKVKSILKKLLLCYCLIETLAVNIAANKLTGLIETSSSFDPSGNEYITFQNKYYYIGENEWENYFSAWNKCTAKGLKLLSIETDVENEFLKNHLAKKNLLRYHFWTSGSNLGHENKFYWFGTGKQLSYTNWDNGEPNNQDGDENCIVTEVSHFKWNDYPCELPKRFICEGKVQPACA